MLIITQNLLYLRDHEGQPRGVDQIANQIRGINQGLIAKGLDKKLSQIQEGKIKTSLYFKRDETHFLLNRGIIIKCRLQESGEAGFYRTTKIFSLWKEKYGVP